MTVRALADADRAAWDALAGSRADSGFMQSWAWGEFKRLEGYEPLRLGLFRLDGMLRGGLCAYAFPAPDGPGLIAAPDGPIVDWEAQDAAAQLEALVAAARDWAAGRRAVALRVEPRLGACPPALAAWPRAPVDLVPDETLEVALGAEPDMLARMKPKGRYNARLAARRGVTVELSDEPRLDELYFILERTAGRQGFRLEPKSFFVNLAASAPAGMLRWAVARYKGMSLAAALTLRFGRTATFLYGGHLPLFPEVMASYALHWELMRDAAAAGFSVYDLYGYAGADRPGHPYAAFSRFKEKLGGVPARRLGSRDLFFYDRLAEAAVGVLRRMRR